MQYLWKGPRTVINKSPEKVVFPQHWESIHCPAFRQEIRALDAFGPGKEVVEFGAGPEVWCLPPLLYWYHDGQPARKMRRGIQEILSLSESLLDELVPESIQRCRRTLSHAYWL